MRIGAGRADGPLERRRGTRRPPAGRGSCPRDTRRCRRASRRALRGRRRAAKLACSRSSRRRDSTRSAATTSVSVIHGSRSSSPIHVSPAGAGAAGGRARAGATTSAAGVGRVAERRHGHAGGNPPLDRARSAACSARPRHRRRSAPRRSNARAIRRGRACRCAASSVGVAAGVVGHVGGVGWARAAASVQRSAPARASATSEYVPTATRPRFNPSVSE